MCVYVCVLYLGCVGACVRNTDSVVGLKDTKARPMLYSTIDMYVCAWVSRMDNSTNKKKGMGSPDIGIRHTSPHTNTSTDHDVQRGSAAQVLLPHPPDQRRDQARRAPPRGTPSRPSLSLLLTCVDACCGWCGGRRPRGRSPVRTFCMRHHASIFTCVYIKCTRI